MLTRELRKRRTPPPEAPKASRPPKQSKQAGASSSAPADGASVLSGAGPVGGADPSSIKDAVNANLAANLGAEDGDPMITGTEIPTGTTVGMTDPAAANDTTTQPPTQTAGEILPTASTSAVNDPNDTGDGSLVNSAPSGDNEPGTEATHEAPENNSTAKRGPPQQGDRIDIAEFGGSFQLDDGSESSMKDILGKSKKGIVIFTYPKANTPGCTKQACLFRDHHTTFTGDSAGYTIYGLSRDSPTSNTSFKNKYSLPYNLICDTKGALLKALGLAKGDKSATRAVVVIAVDGKVVGRMEGGPDATVEAAKRFIADVEGGDDVRAAAERQL